MSKFEPNAVIRGFQLTIVGTVRALTNPELFKYDHFRQAALAIAIGVVIQIILQVPIIGLKFVLWMMSFVIDMESATWDDSIIEGVNVINKSVLQVPFLLMTLMGHITPTLDEIFMESLKWVDTTYVKKHKSDDPEKLRAMYFPNLSMFTKNRRSEISDSGPKFQAIMVFLRRYGRKVGMLLAVYLLSFVPVVGRFVMPAASFYAFRQEVGTEPAAAIFGAGLLFPKRYLISFLHSFFASRSLMRELLEPYFRRVMFTTEQKRRWFKDRQGVLFGFAFAFTTVLKTPFIGVLMYGIAEASTAYLLTKITDPPPAPEESEGFAESQITWKNKHDFLQLSLDNIDKFNMPQEKEEAKSPSFPGKRFS